jgi:hypothetical protein
MPTNVIRFGVVKSVSEERRRTCLLNFDLVCCLQFERILSPLPPLSEAPNVNALWARLIIEECCRLGATVSPLEVNSFLFQSSGFLHIL